jgi:thiamine monophosphate synthase
MLNKKKKLFYFIVKLSEKHLNNILKYKNLNVIYVYNKDDPLNKIIDLRNFCKKNKAKFYLSNNLKITNYLKPDGIHLPATNKMAILNIKKNINIIGTVYNQIDYYRKISQGCSAVFLSPIFFTNKYSYNKKLEVIKFNLLIKNWKVNVMALGGIKSENIKKISLTKTVGFGGISLFEDINPAHNLMWAGFYK